jgi:ketosteroid isomerase-like protein
MAASDLAEAIEQYHRALDVFVTGDPEPVKALFSQRDGATLAIPFGPPAVGREQIERGLDRGASLVREGEPVRYERISEYATRDLAYILEFERVRMKVGGSDEMAPVSLRTTTIFRREDGWRIDHRHADPITSPRPPESIIER